MSFAREKQLASVMTAWPISVRQPSFLKTSTCTVGRIKLAFDYISYDFLPGTLSLNLPDFNSNHRIIDPHPAPTINLQVAAVTDAEFDFDIGGLVQWLSNFIQMRSSIERVLEAVDVCRGMPSHGLVLVVGIGS